MTLIDAHNHGGDSKEETRAFIDGYDKYGIEKGVFAGTSNEEGWDSNDTVLKWQKEYPGRIIGFAYIDLDNGAVDDIDKWLNKGFEGLKVISTKKPYNHPDYLKFYEYAEKIGKPILFHTGFLGGDKPVDVNHYRPVYLDQIGRYFPRLKMICAHLGNPWWEEAYLVIAKRKNIYCDLTGMTLRRRPVSLLEGLFHKDGAFDTACFAKVLFGTDLEVKEMVEYHEMVFSHFNISADLKEKVCGKTFLSLL